MGHGLERESGASLMTHRVGVNKALVSSMYERRRKNRRVRGHGLLTGHIFVHEPGDLKIGVAAQGFQLLGHPPATVFWVVLVQLPLAL